MHKQLQQFLEATWQSPVFGGTFSAAAHNPKMLEWAEQQLGTIAEVVTDELSGYIVAGMPDVPREAVHRIVTREILPKTLAFCPALTVGDLDDTARLAAVSTAVGLMYWGDQTMDRGDLAMAEAIMQLGEKPGNAHTGKQPAPDIPPQYGELVQARLSSLQRIETKISELAKPEDAPFVLDCFYEQVLHNEVRTHSLSLDYIATGNDPAFIKKQGRQLAEISTISAGFPSIVSSLYAIYRQHDATLPPLSKIYATAVLTDLLQVCNVVVRIWDDLGDWRMDLGDDPQDGEFVINPFNQYAPSFIERFCELAFIDGTAQRASLQRHIAAFSGSERGRQEHGTYVLGVLRDHIRDYFQALTPNLPTEFEQYVTLCKRVMEIGYVNRVGDIALMNRNGEDA